MTDTPPTEPAQPVLNLDTMTVGEAIWFEEATGIGIDKIFDPDTSKAKIMLGAAYIALKHENPQATPADAEAVRLVSVPTLGKRVPLSPSDGD